ncbi:MAG TPA: helix-turn-helix domain-containing protein [Ktedonobacterales bacterium]
MGSPGDSEYMTVAEARAVLGVTPRKIADMIKHGALPWEPNPFDRRGKLIKRADVEALRAKQPRDTKIAA